MVKNDFKVKYPFTGSLIFQTLTYLDGKTLFQVLREMNMYHRVLLLVSYNLKFRIWTKKSVIFSYFPEGIAIITAAIQMNITPKSIKFSLFRRFGLLRQETAQIRVDYSMKEKLKVTEPTPTHVAIN